MSTFEGVLDHGERDGWGLWLDPQVAEDPVWRECWAGVESVVVEVGESSIVLQADCGESAAEKRGGRRAEVGEGSGLPGKEQGEPENGDSPEGHRERGRLKWFDSGKGYGFIARPAGKDLFVHRSEVEADPAALEKGREVLYEVGENQRGPAALRVKPS